MSTEPEASGSVALFVRVLPDYLFAIGSDNAHGREDGIRCARGP